MGGTIPELPIAIAFVLRLTRGSGHPLIGRVPGLAITQHMRSRNAFMTAVAALSFLAVLALGSFRGSGTASPDETAPRVVPDPTETALAVAEDFAAAWNAGDAAAAAALVDEAWETVVLPGFADSQFTQRDGRARLPR